MEFKSKRLDKEQQILINLKEEFKQNIKELNSDHQINLGSINAARTVLNFDKTKDFETRTIDSLLGQAFNFATFDARLGVFNNIISSGNLELIKDSKLRHALNQWTGEDGYTKIHFEDKKLMLSSNSIGHFNKILENQEFYLVHKSHLINLNHIEKYLNEGYVILSKNKKIPVSRNRRSEFLSKLKNGD